jgi:long-chain fatty acid transport protein
LFLSLLLIPLPARALDFHTFGLGPKAIGMGNAFTAVADDFSAAWYNPAGMTQSKKVEFGFGYQYMRPFLDVNDQYFRVQDSHSLACGLSLPIPFSAWLEKKLYFGMAFYMPWNLIFGVKVPLPEEPQYLLLENEPRDIIVNPALAFEIHRSLSVGGSVLLSDNTFGTFKATLTPENEAVLDVNQELPTTFSSSAALHFRPGEIWPALKGLQFGFVWRDEFRIEYTFTPLIGIGYIPLIINFQAISLFQPQQFVFGLSYTPLPRVLVAVDLSYRMWSQIPDPNLKTSFNFVFPLFPVTFAPTQDFAPGFHDIWVPRLGAQVQVKESDSLDVFLRLGYAYEASPVPPQTGVTNYLDSDKHIFSFSPEVRLKRWAGKPLPAPVSLGGYVQVHYYEPVSYVKDPSVFQLFPDYPYTEISGSGTILNLGIFVSTSFAWL